MEKKSRLTFLILGLTVSLVLILGGTAYYQYEKGLIIAQAYNELQFIANGKENSIIQWRNERIDNTRSVTLSPFFVEALTKWIAGKNNIPLKDRLLNRLNLLKDNNGYENIIISNANGDVLLSLNKNIHQLDSATFSYIGQDIRKKPLY